MTENISTYAVASYLDTIEDKYKTAIYEAVKAPREIKWFLQEGVAMPTKRETDSGYDVYSKENNVWLKPHQTKLFGTGVHVILPKNIWLWAADRGSTGSKGIHTHCGIIDQEYTGEIFIALCNTNNYPILFTNEVDSFCFKRTWYGRKYACYPISKGIAQLIPVIRPNTTETTIDELNFTLFKLTSARGDGKLGSSGK